MGSSFFWDVTRCRLAISYRRLGKTYLSRLQESSNLYCFTDRFSRNVGDYEGSLCNFTHFSRQIGPMIFQSKSRIETDLKVGVSRNSGPQVLHHAHYLCYSSTQCSALWFLVRATSLVDKRVIGSRGTHLPIL